MAHDQPFNKIFGQELIQHNAFTLGIAIAIRCEKEHGAQTKGTVMTENEAIVEELNELLGNYITCIETQDRTMFDKVWTTEGTCRMISGANMFEGRESLWGEFVNGKIKTAYTTIKIVKENSWFEVIDEDHALIIFKYHSECILRENGEPFGVAGMETQVAKRDPEGWRLLHVHYSK